MRINACISKSVCASVALLISLAAFSVSRAASFNSQTQDPSQPKLSADESKAVSAINAAPDAAAKLAAAEEFVKKYPKSEARLQVAEYVAGQIAQLKDTAQKLALTDSFQKVFTGDKEIDAIKRVILEAYIAADRMDDAFSLAATMLTKNPEDLRVLEQMTFTGTEEVKRQHPKYLAQTEQYAAKAIALIEANRKPAFMDEASWSTDKAALPLLYQQTAILSLLSGKPAEAKAKLEKAIALNAAEPFNYVLLGSIFNDDYQQMAQTYRQMPESSQKQELWKKITAVLDDVIDKYAHAVGLSEGRPEYQKLHDQVLQDLTSYYKFRHSDSTAGLQQLIDKYKIPAKP